MPTRTRLRCRTTATAGRDDDAGVSMGLFDYPLLMAADILIHRAELVPVGLDQQQHVEIARDIAQAFNAQFGEVFVLPEAMIDERGDDDHRDRRPQDEQELSTTSCRSSRRPTNSGVPS